MAYRRSSTRTSRRSYGGNRSGARRGTSRRTGRTRRAGTAGRTVKLVIEHVAANAAARPDLGFMVPEGAPKKAAF